ncbi:hypothetical protein [Streptomyces brevispora]|uniref:hypothetical protein n=1 Tax=Streptomyces brevispora TaxID=887462 RepID=UPI0035DD6E35
MGGIETSILLHVAPDLVRPGNEDYDGGLQSLLPLDMSVYTKSGVIGYPVHGEAGKDKSRTPWPYQQLHGSF